MQMCLGAREGRKRVYGLFSGKKTRIGETLNGEGPFPGFFLGFCRRQNGKERRMGRNGEWEGTENGKERRRRKEKRKERNEKECR